VEAAKVGGFLILAGDHERIEAVRYVDAIFYVDSLDEFSDWLRSKGADFVHKPRTVTGGKNLTARHAKGLVVEYFEAEVKEKIDESVEDRPLGWQTQLRRHSSSGSTLR
jgi:hypothetical protein